MFYTRYMTRISILLVFGGQSAEHEVSVASARNVYAALDKAKYDITLCRVSKKGKWQVVDNVEAPDGDYPCLLPDLGESRFVMQPGNKLLNTEVILPVLHGTGGEDGSLQGLAKLLGIPVVGCGVLASAICMDKEVAKRLLVQANLPVTDYAVHYSYEPVPSFSFLSKRLGTPLFVKPASQGSSVGVSQVTTETGLIKALDDAHMYDKKVLIEKSINGQEVECAVLGNEQPKASAVGEIRPGEDFYSYDDKYSPESTAQLIIPAKLPPETAEEVRRLAIKAYKTLECRGLARVDFFVDGENIYINELNTMPGFTNISMYPKLWQEAGVGYPQLLDELIKLACQ